VLQVQAKLKKTAVASPKKCPEIPALTAIWSAYLLKILRRNHLKITQYIKILNGKIQYVSAWKNI
jgi:hypothetical protein